MASLPMIDRLLWVRRALAGQVRELVVGADHPMLQLELADATDAGLFGPDSVTWRVHADNSMFVGGLRALLLQTVHPLAMAGVAEHSNFRSDPMGRLWRTSAYVGATTYGSTAEARSAIAMVKRVHGRVRGTAPDGRRYAANDPHLLTWVHHTLVDSFLRAYRRYGAAPIGTVDADRYVAEMAVLADEFGAEPAARSVAELRAWFRAEKPELHAGRQARDAVRFLMFPPLPLISRLAYGVIASASVGLLPRSVRRDLWLPSVPAADPLVVRPATRTLMRTLDWVMSSLERPDLPTPGEASAA
ncbi:MAG: oxygenase MpaB family protein [Acidimicrobiales bacterium]